MPVVTPPVDLVRKFLPFFRDELVPALQQLALLVPEAVFTSWYRDPINNARVGGAPNSQHLLAWAADAVVPPESANRFIQIAEGIGFVVVVERDHIHIQAFGRGVVPDSFFPSLLELGALPRL